MADELDPVELQFVGEMEDLLAELDAAVRDVRDFAEASAGASAALGDLRDHAAVAAGVISAYRDHAAGAGEADHMLRDSAIEAGEAMGHVRDEAFMASEEVKHLGDSAADASAKLNMLSLSGFAQWLKPSMFQLITAGVTTGLAALPALVGGIGAAAGIAFGAKLLIGSKQAQGPLYAQFKDMMGGLHNVMQQAVTPLIGPLRQAFASIGQFARSIGPQLHQVFAAIAPAVMPLTHGLEGLVRGVLPGLVSLMHAAAPAVSALAGILSGLGHSLGGMFAAFAPAIRASSVVLTALGSVINGLFPVIGKLAGVFASALAPVLHSVAAVLRALEPALVVVGKVFGELAGAVLASLAGALQAVAQLVKAAAPGFTALAKALGQVFTAMENSGVFGILEDTLEKIAGPLGQMISLLLTGLAPILGQIVGIVIKVAAALSAGLANAIIQLMPSITQFLGMMIRFVTQVLPPMMPALEQLAMSLVKVLIALTPLLPPLLQIYMLFMRWQMDNLKPLIALLPKLAEFLSHVANAIADVIGWVAKVISKITDWIRNLHSVGQAADELRHGIATAFDGIRHDIAAALDDIRHYIASKFDQIRHDIASWGDDVLSWFRALPGRILHALGDFGHLLWNAGRALLEGLGNGVLSAMSWLHSKIDGLGHDIVGWFKDALGIFSPSRITYSHGQMLIQGLVHGMLDGAPQIAAAVAHIAGLVSGAHTPGPSLAMGGILATGASTGAGGPMLGSGHVTVNVPVSMSGMMTPAALQQFQGYVQEAILRYAQLNQGNGLFLHGRLS
jgi:phage-related protein